MFGKIVRLEPVKHDKSCTASGKQHWHRRCAFRIGCNERETHQQIKSRPTSSFHKTGYFVRPWDACLGRKDLIHTCSVGFSQVFSNAGCALFFGWLNPGQLAFLDDHHSPKRTPTMVHACRPRMASCMQSPRKVCRNWKGSSGQ